MCKVLNSLLLFGHQSGNAQKRFALFLHCFQQYQWLQISIPRQQYKKHTAYYIPHFGKNRTEITEFSAYSLVSNSPLSSVTFFSKLSTIWSLHCTTMPSISFSLEVENVGVRVCLRKKNGCVGSLWSIIKATNICCSSKLSLKAGLDWKNLLAFRKNILFSTNVWQGKAQNQTKHFMPNENRTWAKKRSFAHGIKRHVRSSNVTEQRALKSFWQRSLQIFVKWSCGNTQ